MIGWPTYSNPTAGQAAAAAAAENNGVSELRSLAKEVIAAGITRRADGSVELSPEAIKAIQDRAWRQGAVGKVPTLPRFAPRDVAGSVPKTSGSYSTLSWSALRMIREQSAIIKPIHAALMAQLRRLCRRWNGERAEVGWEVTHRAALRRDGEVPKGFQPVIDRFEAILEKPAPGRCETLADLLVAVAEDYLTINRPSVEPLYAAADPGWIVGWVPVDGGLLYPLADWISQHVEGVGWGERQPATTFEDQLRAVVAVYGDAAQNARWVLVRDGLPERFFADNEVIVAPQGTRTDVRWSGYPPSHVEDAVQLISAFGSVFDYNANYFRDGFMPDFALLISGDVAPEAIDGFVTDMQQAALGVGNAHKPLVLPGAEGSTLTKLDLKKSNTEMGFETWMSVLIALTCALYRLDPSTINARPWSGGAAGGLSEPNRALEIELARSDGLQSIVQHITDGLLNRMAARMHPDLVVRWHYGEADAQKDAQVYEQRGRTSLTVNEIRVLQGDPPIPPYTPARELDKLDAEKRAAHDKNPANWVMNPAYTAAMSQAIMLAGMQQQQGQGDGFGGQGSPFGDPTGEYPFGQAPPDDFAGFAGGGAPGGGRPPAPGPGRPQPAQAQPRPAPLAKGSALPRAPRRPLPVRWPSERPT